MIRTDTVFDLADLTNLTHLEPRFYQLSQASQDVLLVSEPNTQARSHLLYRR